MLSWVCCSLAVWPPRPLPQVPSLPRRHPARNSSRPARIFGTPCHPGRGNGTEYLGLRKIIVRGSSWRQLAESFAFNRVDNLPSGRFAIVRGADIPQLGELRLASAEVTAVEDRAAKTFKTIEKLTEPTAAGLLETLDRGVDVLHFTGHSFADEAGERLLLGPKAGLGVPELDAPRSAPAPVCIFCSCHVGLHRKTRIGRTRGIAAALLDGGSPAVVAATVSLPDQAGHDFAIALHFHARSHSMGAAVPSQ